MDQIVPLLLPAHQAVSLPCGLVDALVAVPATQTVSQSHYSSPTHQSPSGILVMGGLKQ